MTYIASRYAYVTFKKVRRSISWVLMYSHYNTTVNFNNWIYVILNFCKKIIELSTLVLITRHHMTHKYFRSLKMPSYEWLLVISISGYRCNHLLTATLRSGGFEEKLWRVAGKIVLVTLLIGLLQQTITWYMVVGKLIIIPALGHQNKGKSSFTGSGLFDVPVRE